MLDLSCGKAGGPLFWRTGQSPEERVAYTVTWSAAEFEYWFNTFKDPVRKQRALDDLTATQRKLRREQRSCIHFASAAKLDVDPCTIQNRDVPEPNCEVSGSSRYFELGELTDES